jgi:hypothetical protein
MTSCPPNGVCSMESSQHDAKRCVFQVILSTRRHTVCVSCDPLNMTPNVFVLMSSPQHAAKRSVFHVILSTCHQTVCVSCNPRSITPKGVCFMESSQHDIKRCVFHVILSKWCQIMCVSWNLLNMMSNCASSTGRDVLLLRPRKRRTRLHTIPQETKH